MSNSGWLRLMMAAGLLGIASCSSDSESDSKGSAGADAQGDAAPDTEPEMSCEQVCAWRNTDCRYDFGATFACASLCAYASAELVACYESADCDEAAFKACAEMHGAADDCSAVAGSCTDDGWSKVVCDVDLMIPVSIECDNPRNGYGLCHEGECGWCETPDDCVVRGQSWSVLCVDGFMAGDKDSGDFYTCTDNTCAAKSDEEVDALMCAACDAHGGSTACE